MGIVSPGFSGRRRQGSSELPPGQYLTKDFPVLSAGPTPRIRLDDWEFVITTETGKVHRWDWAAFRALPTQQATVDIHCVTRWSKLGTHWEGVSLDALFADVETSAVRFDGKDLEPEHGGPARLLVPHLYLWKSAKWVRGITLSDEDRPGFWESLGYHDYGDPWREQRYRGD
jgi:DMSO/TMAO reductase YedYZ molybdopterin-dependent catalytic subunit